MRAYIKISPHAIPPFARVQSLSQKKAPSSQKKASARQKRKDPKLYLNLYVVPVVFVVIVVVLFSDLRAAFSARYEPFSAAASFSAESQHR